MASEQNGY